MTRIICVASGKGGVGKTTLVSNLGSALAKFGKDVIIVDGNLTTPNLGLHLGLPLFPVTIHDVLKGKADIRDAIYEHESGFKIIPAGIALSDLRGVDARDLPNAFLSLLGSADIIIIDASAGLGREALAAMESADELLLITTPDLSSVIDALKASKLAETLGTKVTGIVVNRVTGKRHEMSIEDVQRMLGLEVLAQIPEDIAVHKAVAKRQAVVSHAPSSRASHEIKRLAAHIAGLEYRKPRPVSHRLFDLLLRR